jgi:hypothetical protein
MIGNPASMEVLTDRIIDPGDALRRFGTSISG